MSHVVVRLSICVILLPHWGLAAEMVNHAEDWLKLTPLEKRAYVAGVRDGLFHSYIEKPERWLPPRKESRQELQKRIDDVRRQLLLSFPNNKQLVEVMSDLYKDPANAFIGEVVMLFIARDKLLGENVEVKLGAARKEAILRFETLQSIEPK